jgi:hypothetical protein
LIKGLHTFFSVDLLLVQNPLLDNLLWLIVKDGSVLLELVKDLVGLNKGVVDDVFDFFLVFSNFGETFGGETFFELRGVDVERRLFFVVEFEEGKQIRFEDVKFVGGVNHPFEGQEKVDTEESVETLDQYIKDILK